MRSRSGLMIRHKGDLYRSDSKDKQQGVTHRRPSAVKPLPMLMLLLAVIRDGIVKWNRAEYRRSVSYGVCAWWFIRSPSGPFGDIFTCDCAHSVSNISSAAGSTSANPSIVGSVDPDCLRP